MIIIWHNPYFIFKVEKGKTMKYDNPFFPSQIGIGGRGLF